MQLLKNGEDFVGDFVLITPAAELRAQLMRIEEAGRTCYQSGCAIPTVQSATKFVRMVLKRGHESVIEHSCLTVKFFNVSRGFTHEMVRHRLCAFSQESTRYVDYAKGAEDLAGFKIKCIAPPRYNEKEFFDVQYGDETRKMTLDMMFDEHERHYRALRQAGWPPEDARQVLPIGIKSEIVVSANFREWRHIFRMRTHKSAHWEIRTVMTKLLAHLQEIVPVVFDDISMAVKEGK